MFWDEEVKIIYETIMFICHFTYSCTERGYYSVGQRIIPSPIHPTVRPSIDTYRLNTWGQNTDTLQPPPETSSFSHHSLKYVVAWTTSAYKVYVVEYYLSVSSGRSLSSVSASRQTLQANKHTYSYTLWLLTITDVKVCKSFTQCRRYTVCVTKTDIKRTTNIIEKCVEAVAKKTNVYIYILSLPSCVSVPNGVDLLLC